MDNQKIDFNFGTFREDGKDLFAYQLNGVGNITKIIYEKIDELVLKNMPDDIFYDLALKIQKEEINRNNGRN